MVVYMLEDLSRVHMPFKYKRTRALWYHTWKTTVYLIVIGQEDSQSKAMRVHPMYVHIKLLHIVKTPVILHIHRSRIVKLPRNISVNTIEYKNSLNENV